FTAIKLTLADGERVWSADDASSQPAQFVKQDFQGGRCGILELSAPSATTEGNGSIMEAQEPPPVPCITDPRLFEIVSELLMEGWMKAAAKWSKDSKTPLRFDS